MRYILVKTKRQLEALDLKSSISRVFCFNLYNFCSFRASVMRCAVTMFFVPSLSNEVSTIAVNFVVDDGVYTKVLSYVLFLLMCKLSLNKIITIICFSSVGYIFNNHCPLPFLIIISEHFSCHIFSLYHTLLLLLLSAATCYCITHVVIVLMFSLIIVCCCCYYCYCYCWPYFKNGYVIYYCQCNVCNCVIIVTIITAVIVVVIVCLLPLFFSSTFTVVTTTLFINKHLL